MKIRKAVIPVAGFGTRFLPATRSVPKVMFPVFDTPAVHYAVQEAAEAGIDRNQTTSLEGVISMDPEVIFIAQPPELGGEEFRQKLLSDPALAQLPAIREGRVYLVENRLFTTLSFWNIRGAEELARHVVELVDSGVADFKPLYEDALPLWDKVERIATRIYGASGISADDRIRKQFEELQGPYGHFPVCMAKTQFSLSTDPNLKGAPEGHVVPIREVRVSGGAEFLVVVAGAIMTMPGLPRVPAANSIFLNDEGQVEGLF